MPKIAEEMIHTNQMKVRLFDETKEKWGRMSLKNGQVPSVMLRISMIAILDQWEKTGEIPEFIRQTQA